MAGVFGPSSEFTNPGELRFDRTGRLLFLESASALPGVWSVASGGAPSGLIQLPGNAVPTDLAVDGSNRIFVLNAAGVVSIHAADGTLLEGAFASGLTNAHLDIGPGGAWGRDMWVIEPSGDLVRFDSSGAATLQLSGLGTNCSDLIATNANAQFQLHIARDAGDTASAFTASSGGVHLILSWSAGPAQAFAIESSLDLIQWTEAPVAVVEFQPGRYEAALKQPASGQRFFRLRRLTQ